MSTAKMGVFTISRCYGFLNNDNRLMCFLVQNSIQDKITPADVDFHLSVCLKLFVFYLRKSGED